MPGHCTTRCRVHRKWHCATKKELPPYLLSQVYGFVQGTQDVDPCSTLPQETPICMPADVCRTFATKVIVELHSLVCCFVEKILKRFILLAKHSTTYLTKVRRMAHTHAPTQFPRAPRASSQLSTAPQVQP